MDFGAVNAIAFKILPWAVGFLVVLLALWVWFVRLVANIKVPKLAVVSMLLITLLFAFANTWLFSVMIYLIRG